MCNCFKDNTLPISLFLICDHEFTEIHSGITFQDQRYPTLALALALDLKQNKSGVSACEDLKWITFFQSLFKAHLQLGAFAGGSHITSGPPWSSAE